MSSMEDVKVGKKILVEGTPHEVMKMEHVKVAQGKGLQRCVLRNLLTGNSLQRTFREVDTVEPADIGYLNTEYQYADSEFHFMDTDTYEQIDLSKEVVGDADLFLVEGDKVILMTFEGRPINVQLEPAVTLEVTETPPGEKGDTATGGKKPATLSTGLVVQVPLFMKEGDKVRVDTRTHEYLGRA
jgi:elongation factor P